MPLRPPRPKRTYPLFPYTTLVRTEEVATLRRPRDGELRDVGRLEGGEAAGAGHVAPDADGHRHQQREDTVDGHEDRGVVAGGFADRLHAVAHRDRKSTRLKSSN